MYVHMHVCLSVCLYDCMYVWAHVLNVTKTISITRCHHQPYACQGVQSIISRLCQMTLIGLHLPYTCLSDPRVSIYLSISQFMVHHISVLALGYAFNFPHHI